MSRFDNRTISALLNLRPNFKVSTTGTNRNQKVKPQIYTGRTELCCKMAAGIGAST